MKTVGSDAQGNPARADLAKPLRLDLVV